MNITFEVIEPDDVNDTPRLVSKELGCVISMHEIYDSIGDDDIYSEDVADNYCANVLWVIKSCDKKHADWFIIFSVLFSSQFKLSW